MPIEAPKLDTRTFEDLVAEARARIPRFTPEWTNLNDADPGMTLVKLHAWLTDTLLYQLNRLPELNYIKFLQLLNVKPRPAVAAQAELTFTLKKLNRPTDPLVVQVPAKSQVGVDDPDLEEELVFETDRTLTALNAAIAAVVVPRPKPGNPDRLDLVTEYDAKAAEARTKYPFFPFGPEPKEGGICHLGFLLRPHLKDDDAPLDRFPEGELDLAVFVPEPLQLGANQERITDPSSTACLFPWQVAEEGERVVWEAYDGTEPETDFDDVSPTGPWQRLDAHGEARGLARGGHVYLEVPGGLPAIGFDRLDREFWERLSLRKPPTTNKELADDILEGSLAAAKLDKSIWKKAIPNEEDHSKFCTLLNTPDTTHQQLADFLSPNRAVGTPPYLTLHAIEEDVWLDAGYDEAPVSRKLTWFRARLGDPPARAPEVRQFQLNTVAATAAVTRVEEIVGESNGRPNQSFQLSRTPVLVTADAAGKLTPALEVELEPEQGDPEDWSIVDSFYDKGPDAAVFLLDSETGTLTFGDGEHGRIPVAGSQIVARRYRYGGGAVGNAGPGTITALKSALPDVDSVTNLNRASGGHDAESLADVMLRAPHDLRARERAVTGADFAELATRTPGVPIHRAYALPLTKVDASVAPPKLVADSPGAVTVVILPRNEDATPQPSTDQLRLVCNHLNDRRLITTELFVTGPRYLEIEQLTLEATVDRQSDLLAVREAIVERLSTYFHPLRGGEDERGWPFGQDIYFGHIYREILNIDGLVRVLCLEMTPANGATCRDVLEVPIGHLIYLPGKAIDPKVRYDRDA